MSPVRAWIPIAWIGFSGCIVPTPGLLDTTHRTNTSPLELVVEIGCTTREEVLLALGEPDWSSPYGGGVLYVAAYVDLVIVLVGQYGGAVIPVGHHRIVSIDFDPEGYVKRLTTNSPPALIGMYNE